MSSPEISSALIFSGSEQIGDIVLLSRVAAQLIGGLSRMDVGYVAGRASSQLVDLIDAGDVSFVELPRDTADPFTQKNAILRTVAAFPHLMHILLESYDRHYVCNVESVRYFPKVFPHKLRILTNESAHHDLPFVDTYTHILTQEHGLLVDPNADIYFQIPQQNQERVRQWKAQRGVEPGDKYLVMNLGTRDPIKDWPIERFADLERRLNEWRDLPIFYVNPPGIADVIRVGLNPEMLMMGENQGLPPLAESVSLIADATAYVGADTGLTHISAVVRTPLVAIFTDKLRGYWNPTGDEDKIRILSAESPKDITVDRVEAELASFV